MRSKIQYYLSFILICSSLYLNWNTPSDKAIELNNNHGSTELAPAFTTDLTTYLAAVDIQTQYNLLLEKPLFLSTRTRPTYVKTEEKDKYAPLSMLPFIIKGILISGDKRMIIIKRANDADVTAFTLGQSIDEWVIDSIQKDSVTLRMNEKRQLFLIPERKY